ncbi:AAA family ATPase [Microlunatus parietis]|uniref:DNA primase/polymerase bifunctional N-terminal domain-containing protein n=1 Tax=Microlunatus parietis TaxID=682979 RepID=A0A7Y9IB47_9ACTN|nr:AAA family ATPase [Microlunatus parietis]NYE73584.1 hypothetical protein [Microlunatus parietis]
MSEAATVPIGDDHESDAALEAVRELIKAGAPVFLARPAMRYRSWDPGGGDGGTGYRLPPGWQATEPDLSVLDRWQPGDALAMVGGVLFDVIDTDRQHDGEAARDQLRAAGLWPTTYGTVATPSGGLHEYVTPLGIGKDNGGAVGPGIDLVGGLPDGSGRGFVFLPPTSRLSKITGEVRRYRWTEPLVLGEGAGDDSGAALAERVRAARGRPVTPDQGHSGVSAVLSLPVSPAVSLSADQRTRARLYVEAAIKGIKAELAASAGWPEGHRDDHGRGWERMQADAALRLASLARADWNDLDLGAAKAAFMSAAPTSGRWTVRDVDQKWTSQARRATEARMPDLAELVIGDGVPVVTGDQVPIATLATADVQGEAGEDTAQDYETRVAREAARIRIRRDARRIVDAEDQPPAPPFDIGTLAEILARPEEPPARIDQLMPWEGSLLIAAQRKTGKSTLVLNIARSLITGEPLLGRFQVRPVSGTVALLNFEVSGTQVARWADEVGVPRDQLHLVNLRGRRNPFIEPEDLERLARELRGREVETLIVDPFGRAYPDTDQEHPGPVQRWLVQLDQFARADVGARDVILTTHTGWNGERTRGSSAQEDWADSILTMVKDDPPDGDGARYLRAIGRDVDLDEERLDYDSDSRQLTMSGAGGRRKARASEKVAAMIPVIERVVADSPGITTRYLRDAARRVAGEGCRNGDIDSAIKRAEELGNIRVESGGPGRPTHHYPVQEASPDVV